MMALNSPMEEIAMHAKLVEGYARKIRQLGGLEDSGKAIIQEVQMVCTFAVLDGCMSRASAGVCVCVSVGMMCMCVCVC